MAHPYTPLHTRMQPAKERIRLYSALVRNFFMWAGVTLYRKLAGKAHPMNWSLQQDLSVCLMRGLFEYGTYQHWRKFISMMRESNTVPQLVLDKVPKSNFSTAGSRSSWWVTLQPDEYPSQPRASVVIMYMHGGAFMAGEPLMYQPAYCKWMRQLAAQGIRARVFAVGYPLAPDQPFPRSIQGVAEAYQWLLQEMGSSDSVILAGDSAGGNLVIAALAYLRDNIPATAPVQQQQQKASDVVANDSTTAAGTAAAAAAAVGGGFHPPLAAILISPATDLSQTSVFLRHKQQQGQGSGVTAPLLAAGSSSSEQDVFRWDYVSSTEGQLMLRQYVFSKDQNTLTNPLVSPIYIQDFTGLLQQQMLVIAGGCESMVSDIRRFATVAGSSSSNSSNSSASSSKVKSSSSDAGGGGLIVQYHEEAAKPHCYALLDMGDWLELGAQVIVPFIADMAVQKKGQ